MIPHVDCSQINGAIYKCSKRCLAEQKNLARQQVMVDELTLVAEEYANLVNGFDATLRIENGVVTWSWNK